MSLDVHLYGERIGTLFPAGEGDYRLAYEPGRIADFGPGGAILSNSLPATVEPYSAHSTRTYVEGLLPQGMRRQRLARELGIDPTDGYALIAEIGRDCPGGVCFVPAEEGEPPTDPGPAAWLGEEEMEELSASPPSRIFDPERPQRMRFALGGERHKLSLVRGSGGRWAWPDVRRPSTHIVKPETGEYPELVANEMFCATLFREVGLPVSPARVETIGGRDCFVSERFDRMVEGGPVATRFHQESFCQALGYAPVARALGGDDGDGPGFVEAAGLLKAVGDSNSLSSLLAIAFCNYIVGNGDAHGDNFALVLVDDGALLAPTYDVVSTAVYDDPTHTGMVLGADYEETAYLVELAKACEELGLDFQHGRRVATHMAGKASAAIEIVADRARGEGWHGPVVEEIRELATERALGLGYEVEY